MRGLRPLTAILCLISLSVLAADLPELLKSLDKQKPTDSVKELKETARFSGLASWATSVAFSPDDKSLWIGLKDKIEIVDVDKKTTMKTIDLKSGQVRSIVFSPDGKTIATGSYQRATLIHADSGQVFRELKGHRGYVTSVAFSPAGQRLATACEDEATRVWDVAADSAPLVLKGHGYPVTGVAWSPDGSQLATSAGDDTRPTKPGQVKIWDAKDGTVKQQFELHKKAATGIAFSPDAHFVLSSSVDEHVNVYDLKNNKPLGFFAGHARPTNAVVAYPDGETAISVSGGRAVGKNELIIWEIENGETLATVQAHEAKITSLAISHDGRRVATASQDKSVALWNIGFLAVGIPDGSTAPAAEQDNPADAAAATGSETATAGQAAAAEPAIVKPEVKELRAGIIGLDTSHAAAFTKTLNANPPNPMAVGCRVVAAYPKGSPDIQSSVERVPAYTEEIKKLGVEIVDSIDDLLKKVDVVLLETNDGRPHFEQLLPCLKAGKPVFIDKPIAASLSDSIAIFEAAKKYNVPVFSSSSLRFGKNSLAVRDGSIGKVTRCETSSPAAHEPTHPDLYWYGIHGVESLFTVMGTGCQSVVRGKTADGKIEVKGVWKDGREGIFREGSGYQGKAIGDKGESPVGSYDGYDPLVFAIVKFFHTGVAPVSPDETLEIYAFMEAADESKRQSGASVTLESVMAKARAEAQKKLAELK